jgi:hypothetical protein
MSQFLVDFQKAYFHNRTIPAELVRCIRAQHEGAEPAIAALLAEHGFRILTPQQRPSLLSSDYLSAEDRANPDIASNIVASEEIMAKIAWFWEDDDGNLAGYWLGDDAALPNNPIVVGYDSEGQFSCEGAITLGDLIASKCCGADDDRYLELAAEAAAAGLPITVPTLDASYNVHQAVDPNEMRNKLYYQERAKRGLDNKSQ